MGCKAIEIRKSEFVAKTQFLCNNNVVIIFDRILPCTFIKQNKTFPNCLVAALGHVGPRGVSYS